MNRCKRALVIPFLSAIVGLTTLTVTFVPSDARAQMTARQFPPTARRGTLEVLTPPEILIDGKAERLSPGARIRGLDLQARLKQFMQEHVYPAEQAYHDEIEANTRAGVEVAARECIAAKTGIPIGYISVWVRD